MQIHEILIIKNGAESYGISIENINQISRVPLLMPLPLRPKSVRGLCAVSGSIVSMIDFNVLLGMDEVKYNASKTRILSLNNEHASNALLVSEVYDTVVVNQEKIEYINQDDNPVLGIYKYEDMLVQVMSLETLFMKIERVEIAGKEVKNGKPKLEITQEEDTTRFLIFALEKETFALDIEYLQEIILADTQITQMNGSEPEVLGVITIRDEILLVIDLRVYYDFKDTKSEKNRILIASYDGKRVGLLVDDVVDIENYPASAVEYMENSFEENKISGVLHTKESIISFFDYNVLNDIFTKNESFIDQKIDTEDTISTSESREVIVFKLLDREYAFDVDSVDEIIDSVDATQVAFTESSIAGIINIRGQIVTLVSLFDKLNIETKIDEDSKIIVCNINENRIGFVVDSVSDILDVPLEDMRKEESDIFTDVLYLENGARLVLAMDINKLVSKEKL